MMFCRKCGNPLNPGVNFCRICGTPPSSPTGPGNKEPYTKPISRNDPGCFLFLIDQSESMSLPFGGETSKLKSQGVADAINNVLIQLINTCTKGFALRDYFYVGVIGYGASVGPALGGSLSGRDLIRLSEISANVRVTEHRSEDRAGGVNESFKVPVWLEPVAKNGTPMCAALKYARRVLSGWITQYPNSYPPIVINITDGESNDGDPLSEARRLAGISTSDGNILLFNCHLSSSNAPPISFPDSMSNLPDQYALKLFEMSSVLPERMRNEARTQGLQFNLQTRGFVFNAGIAELVQMLDVGTKGNPRPGMPR
jgi:hypothetical protein